jgi:hypothetical protein
MTLCGRHFAVFPWKSKSPQESGTFFCLFDFVDLASLSVTCNETTFYVAWSILTGSWKYLLG